MAEQPLKRTPLNECHRSAGAKLVPFAGWEMPLVFGSLLAEHRAVREAAGLFDVSHMGELEVSGPGALDFLQAVTPNDVSKLVPGRAHYSALLDESGGMIDDLLVYRLEEERFLLVVNAGPREEDLAWLQARAPESSVVLRDRSDELALLALQGPRAADILAPLVDLDLGSIKYYRFAAGEVAGEPGIVSRTGYTGEDGFELYVPPEKACELWRALLDAGEPYGLRPIGLGARDTLRLEAGMLLSGQDFDRETSPLEVGLAWMVKLDKGEFVGRGALLEQKRKGLRRQLVAFEVADKGIARSGHRVRSKGGSRGVVTSGSFSPTLDRGIGLAMMSPQLDEEETDLVVEVRRRELEARRVALPFYRRPRPGSS